jgi:hypothetical protein
MGTGSTMKRGRGIGLLLSSLALLGACGSGSAAHVTPGGTGSAGAGGAGAGGMSGRVPANHRPVATGCPTDRPVGSCPGPDAGDGTIGYECHNDNECNDGGQNGRCQHIRDLSVTAGLNECVCSYDTCFSDADCNGSGPCVCRVGQASANDCISGNCHVDADCGPGGYCSPTVGDCVVPADPGLTSFGGYYCHTRNDTCLDDADCGGGGNNLRNFCRYNEVVSAWYCETNERICGE